MVLFFGNTSQSKYWEASNVYNYTDIIQVKFFTVISFTTHRKNFEPSPCNQVGNSVIFGSEN